MGDTLCRSTNAGDLNLIFDWRYFLIKYKTAQKMEFFVKGSSSKCDKICSVMWIFSHLQENF